MRCYFCILKRNVINMDFLFDLWIWSLSVGSSAIRTRWWYTIISFSFLAAWGKEYERFTDNFCLVFLLSSLIFPWSSLKTPLSINLFSFCYIRFNDACKITPYHNIMVLSLILFYPCCIFPASIRGKAECCNFLSTWGFANFRYSCYISDKLNLIERIHKS